MNLILEKEQKEQFLVNMQLPGIELMRLSLDIIELVKKREKTSTSFSTFFDLKNKSQKLETAFLDFGTLYIKNPKGYPKVPSLACACVVINS